MFYREGKIGEAGMGRKRSGREAPRMLLMSLKRWVHGIHGHLARPKSTILFEEMRMKIDIFFLTI
jgi:hypothetical protein